MPLRWPSHQTAATSHSSLTNRDARARIWVRALDSLTAQRLDRTEGADMPFWSPDSQHIGYFADGKLMRISVAGALR